MRMREAVVNACEIEYEIRVENSKKHEIDLVRRIRRSYNVGLPFTVGIGLGTSRQESEAIHAYPNHSCRAVDHFPGPIQPQLYRLARHHRDVGRRQRYK